MDEILRAYNAACERNLQRPSLGKVRIRKSCYGRPDVGAGPGAVLDVLEWKCGSVWVRSPSGVELLFDACEIYVKELPEEYRWMWKGLPDV